jgi:hypothetical protein
MEIMSFDQEINTFKLQISAPRELLAFSTDGEFVELDSLKNRLDSIKESGLPCMYLVTKKTEYIENGWYKQTEFTEYEEFEIYESGLTIGICKEPPKEKKKPKTSNFEWGQQEDDDTLIIF